MGLDQAGPSEIAAAIVEEISRPAANRAVEAGSARAAAEIAALL